MTRDQVIERVQKLLSRNAGWGATEAESQIALAMAQRLMAEHNLAMEDLKAGEATEDWSEVDVAEAYRFGIDEQKAATICERFFFVKAYLHCVSTEYTGGYRSRNKWSCRFFGKPSNLESAKWVFNALLGAFDSLWLDFKVRHHADRSERRDFVAGVAAGFTRKLASERRDLEQEHRQAHATATGGTSLAVIDHKVVQAFNAEMARRGAKLGKATPLKDARDGNAYSAGVQAGSNLNLNRPLGGSRKSLPR